MIVHLTHFLVSFRAIPSGYVSFDWLPVHHHLIDWDVEVSSFAATDTGLQL